MSPPTINTKDPGRKRQRSASPSPTPTQSPLDPSQPPHTKRPTMSSDDSPMTPPQPPASPPPIPPRPLGGIISNGVRTMPSGLKITATPPTGFPIPQLGESVWRNVSNENRLRWPNKTGPKAWVRVYRAKYEENAQSTVAKLKGVITQLIDDKFEAQNLIVSTPTAEKDLDERLPPPWHFLISGISEPSINALTHLAVCSSPEITCLFVAYNQPLPEITCLFVAYNQPLPEYICTLENFSYPDSETSNAAIALITKQTLLTSHEIAHFLRDQIPMSASAAADMINTIRVNSLIIANPSYMTTKYQTVWNLYVTPPSTLSMEQFRHFCSLVRGIRFYSDDYGSATARLGANQFTCVGCKSVDHPSGMCPLLRVHGWFGPKANATEDASLAERDVNINTSPRKSGRMITRGGRSPTRGARGSGPRGRGFGSGRY